MSGNDDLGYIRLHEAIRMGESLGLVGDGHGNRDVLSPEQPSEEMELSTKRTAWGLFHVDTYSPPAAHPNRRQPANIL